MNPLLLSIVVAQLSTTPPPAVSDTSQAGTAGNAARANHTHAGVRSIYPVGNIPSSGSKGDVGITPGSNVTITPGTDPTYGNPTYTISASGVVSGYATVDEEAGALAQRNTVNFIGPAVTAVDNAGAARTDVTVVASGTGACAANQWASTLNNGAAPSCTQPSFSNLSGTGAVAQGGTGQTTAPDDKVLVGDGTTLQQVALPSCTGYGVALTYDPSTNTFGCNRPSGLPTIGGFPKAMSGLPKPPCNALRRTNCQ